MRSVHLPKISSLEHVRYLLISNTVCLLSCSRSFYWPATDLSLNKLIEIKPNPPPVVAVVLSQGGVSPSQPVTLDLTISLVTATAEFSSAEEALRGASEVMNVHDTWFNALKKIEWVMNSVSSIAAVCTLSIVANFNQPDFCLAAQSVREDGMEFSFNNS